MTPGARVAAAIEVLDTILGGTPAEQALTRWARSHRFAGSKDRAAIRDHVFQALRCRASYAWLGGAETGRGIMLGAARAAGQEAAWFSGEGYAPDVVAEGEAGRPLTEAPRAVRLDWPDWLLPEVDAAFPDNADRILTVMQQRAGVFLRVNLGKTDVPTAQAELAAEGIETEFIQSTKTALQVIENERRVAHSKAYMIGLVEVQDTASQIAIERLGLRPGLRVLDYCAGGGGKALAMAALGAEVVAHDVDPNRMVDIAPRAARAGVSIRMASREELAGMPPFDLVLCDAPCSGSGTWRRSPAAKWSLTPERLEELTCLQDEVLQVGAQFVGDAGTLAYATCSIFPIENAARVALLDGWEAADELVLAPGETQDGFYLSVLRRKAHQP